MKDNIVFAVYQDLKSEDQIKSNQTINRPIELNGSTIHLTNPYQDLPKLHLDNFFTRPKRRFNRKRKY